MMIDNYITDTETSTHCNWNVLALTAISLILILQQETIKIIIGESWYIYDRNCYQEYTILLTFATLRVLVCVHILNTVILITAPSA